MRPRYSFILRDAANTPLLRIRSFPIDDHVPA
jgi:hypothetical protein